MINVAAADGIRCECGHQIRMNTHYVHVRDFCFSCVHCMRGWSMWRFAYDLGISEAELIERIENKARELLEGKNEKARV